jgi:hypothetical protein
MCRPSCSHPNRSPGSVRQGGGAGLARRRWFGDFARQPRKNESFPANTDESSNTIRTAL